VRIICRPGTVARFALLCIILGILLGFFLGMHVRAGQTPVKAISIRPSPARADVAPDAGAPAGRRIAAVARRP
jgi:hypothetical protein